MRDVVIVGAVLVAAMIGLRRPVFGLLTFVFLSVFSPNSYTWSFGRTIPLSQIVAICTILGIFLSPERKKFSLQSEGVVLVLLWATFAWSTAFALFPEAARERLIEISKILLMAFVAIVVIDSQERVRALIRVIGFSLGFYGLKGGVFAIISGGNYLVYGPEQSFLAANNAIGLALAMNLPILFYLHKTEQVLWVRWIVKAMIVFNYPAIICTYSRGAWLGMMMATAGVLLKRKHKFVTLGAVGVVAVFLLLLAPAIAPDRLVSRYDSLVNYEQDTSAESRFWNWEFCRRVGFARPFTGGGFNFYAPQAYQLYYPEFIQRWGTEKVWSCHSTWLTIFGEQGVPGSAMWLLLLGICFVDLRKITKYAKFTHVDPHYAQQANMIQSSFLAYLVVGTFLDAAYFDLYYYLVVLVVCIKRLVIEKQHIDKTAPSRKIVEKRFGMVPV